MLRPILLAVALLLGGRELVGQEIEVTLQGGVHAARLDRPERTGSVKGEATTVGLRVGPWFTDHWGIEVGVAWSRNRSYVPSPALPPPSAYDETVFTSATLRVRPTSRGAAVTVIGLVGPALIFHGGDGTSLLTRQTDVGVVVGAAAEARVFTRIGLRLDVHNYLFSSNFTQPYQPPLVGSPTQPAGEQFRHEWVVLAGATFSLGY